MMLMRQILYCYFAELCHDDVSDEMMKTSSCSSFSSPEKSDRAVVAVKTTPCPSFGMKVRAAIK